MVGFYAGILEDPGVLVNEEGYEEWETKLVERVADRVFEKVQADFYAAVGRTVVKAALYVGGTALCALVLWELGRGALKVTL